MDLNERVAILIQAAELAQKSGVLTLDDAYAAKLSVDVCRNGGDIKSALENLIKIASIGQRGGAYTLRDAHFIFLASENLDSIFTEN